MPLQFAKGILDNCVRAPTCNYAGFIVWHIVFLDFLFGLRSGNVFQRLEKIIGIESLNKIHDTKIMVIGIGGVGGYVVEALVRSGVQNIILVDFDVVDATNKNRQIIALDSTIGMKKVEAMKKRILDINKECNITTIDTFLDSENTSQIIEKYNPDYVVDACDTITTKKEIITSCLKYNIKFISSMGTGNKLDPSRLQISELFKTSYDPLAKILRKWAKDERIKGKIPVIWSDEIPVKTHDRTPGSTSFVPSSAGLMIASYIINDIIKTSD